MVAENRQQLWWWGAVIAIALAGLALRLVAAHGALWTDEAWSVIYAAQARDPIGVFLRINHDNNHHLYSLWLQAIGPGASPLLARAPAIIAGSLAITVAALLVARRCRIGGIVAALLFAFSPTMLVFGSEARGYAMMLLAGLTMLLLVGDALDGRRVRGARWRLAGLAVFGMFSHLTMAAPVALAALWFYLERRPELGPRAALPATLRLMGPALAATAGVILFVFAAAAASPAGMRLGGYAPFSERDFAAALDDLGVWSAGIATPLPLLAPAMVAAAALFIFYRRPEWLGSHARLYALLLLALPLAVLALRPGNTGFPRYYLICAVGLLLLLSEWIGRGLAARAPVRAGAAALLAAILVVGTYGDVRLIAAERGHPEAALHDIAELSSSGARIALDQPRLQATVALAARQTNYPVRFAAGCAPAEFLLASQSRWKPTPPTVRRCGVAMHAIDSSVITPMTGDSWVLYRAESLQSPGALVSGRVPGEQNRQLSGRAGVAQG
jgi:hypothetical protein